MSKQKRHYNFTRIRPSSQLRVRTNEEGNQPLKVDGLIYSNLFHNYERVQRKDSTPKLSYSQVCTRGSKSVKAYEMGIKQLQPKLPFDQYYFSQRNGLQPDNKKQSNYFVYLERSFSRRSQRSKLRSEKKEKTKPDLSKSELITPCKVSAIKIQIRNHESKHNLKELRDSVRLIQKKHSESFKPEQGMGRKKKVEQLIEPWLMNNYQSIVL